MIKKAESHSKSRIEVELSNIFNIPLFFNWKCEVVNILQKGILKGRMTEL